MSFDDAVANFCVACVCRVRHPKVKTCSLPWQEVRRPFQIVYSPIGEVRTGLLPPHVPVSQLLQLPYYHLSVNFSISLHQQDQRCVGSRQYLELGIAVLMDMGWGQHMCRRRRLQGVPRSADPAAAAPSRRVPYCSTHAWTVRRCGELPPVPLTKTAADGQIHFTDAVYKVFGEISTCKSPNNLSRTR